MSKALFIYLGVVPDGDPCDFCPRTLGRGGRRVQINGVRYRVCFNCLRAERKAATTVTRER